MKPETKPQVCVIAFVLRPVRRLVHQSYMSDGESSKNEVRSLSISVSEEGYTAFLGEVT